MSRIAKVYAARFADALRALGARRVDRGVEWQIRAADRLVKSEALEPPRALVRVYARLEEILARYQGRKGGPRSAVRSPLSFCCDAGLGGLARWLRAYGYDTHWTQGIEDAELIRQAERASAVLLTTDSLMMERGILRDGIVPAFWLPPVLTIAEQLQLVIRHFALQRREPRCMRCGGELVRIDKESARDRIPPKTCRWLDEFYNCTRCNQLFWKGTHWQRINQQLEVRADETDAQV